MSTPIDAIRDCGLVAVVTVDDVGSAVPLGEALLSAGLPIVEVTLRTDGAFDAMKALAGGVPGVVVGAGTVLDLEAARRAVDSGAEFLVSPGLASDVIEWASGSVAVAIPGTYTASEVMAARRLGCRVVKLFPAGGADGVSRVAAFGSVFPDVEFIPTGGVDLTTLPSYLERPNVAAVGGSWIAPRDTIAAADYETVRHRAAEAVAVVRRERGGS